MKDLSVHIFTTSDCNLKCAHCFNDAGLDSPKKSRIPGDDVVKYVKGIEAIYPDVDFEIEGGEIFLHPDFPKILKSLPCLSKCVITTNGTIPFDFTKVLPKEDLGKFLLRVSIEGHRQDIHSKIRDSNLKDVLTRAKDWQDQGLDVMLRVTLHRENYKKLREMIEYFSELGFRKIQLVELQASGRGKSIDELTLTEEEMEEVLNELLEIEFNGQFQRFKLNISKGRMPLINRIVWKNGFSFRKSDYLSLVINWDNSLSCCPWNNFKNSEDRGKSLDFARILPELLQKSFLEHDCNHCSIGAIIWDI